MLSTFGDVLDGRLVIDATNDPARAGRFHHLESYEARVPEARVYRAFNTLGWENFAEPAFGDERADLFYSGPDAEDRGVVERLVTDAGLRPIYVGSGHAAADVLDGVTRLYFALSRQYGRHLAFRPWASRRASSSPQHRDANPPLGGGLAPLEHSGWPGARGRHRGDAGGVPRVRLEVVEDDQASVAVIHVHEPALALIHRLSTVGEFDLKTEDWVQAGERVPAIACAVGGGWVSPGDTGIGGGFRHVGRFRLTGRL